MAEPVPSPDEIMSLAHDILTFAVRRRGENELDHPPEGSPYTEGFYADLHRQYSWIVDAFAQALALAPDPARLQPLIDAGRQGETVLTGGVEIGLAGLDINGNVIKAGADHPVDPFWSTIHAIDGKVADWAGDAADNFRGNFLSGVGTVPANQAMLFRALQFAMVAAKKVYEQFLRDLKDLASKARAALHPSGCHPPSLDVVIGLAEGIVTTAISVATTVDGAGALELIGNVIDLVTTAADSGKDGGGERHAVEGADVAAILECTNDLLNQTVGYLNQCERDIINNIAFNDKNLLAQSSYFTAPAPAVVELARKPMTQWWNEFD